MKFFLEGPGRKKIPCKELTVSLYKQLLKTLLGEEPEPEIVLLNLNETLQELLDKKEDFVQSFNLFDLFYIITDIRAFSIGNTTTLFVTKNGNRSSLEIDLIEFKEALREKQEDHFPILIKYNETTIEINLPTPSRLADEEHVGEICKFLTKISINGVYEQTIKTNKEAETVLNNIPVSLYLEINQKLQNSLEELGNFNFLEKYKITDQRLTLSPSLEHFVWFMKILFRESLDDFYNNVYYLSHFGHMNNEYLEKCTPGEYKLFAKLLQSTFPTPENTENPTDFSAEETFVEE